MQEGGEDAAVAAVFGAGGADGDVGFEDGEADGGGGHGLEGGGWVGGFELEDPLFPEIITVFPLDTKRRGLLSD